MDFWTWKTQIYYSTTISTMFPNSGDTFVFYTPVNCRIFRKSCHELRTLFELIMIIYIVLLTLLVLINEYWNSIDKMFFEWSSQPFTFVFGLVFLRSSKTLQKQNFLFQYVFWGRCWKEKNGNHFSGSKCQWL